MTNAKPLRTAAKLHTEKVHMFMRRPIVDVVLEQGAKMPARAHDDDAGADLTALFPGTLQAMVIAPGGHGLVPTGVRVRIPSGYVGYVCPRSGLANARGVTVLNAPGIIDAGYTGEIMVNLVNTGDTEFIVTDGMRIAQLVVAPIAQPVFHSVDTLAQTPRGTYGHGSTGV